MVGLGRRILLSLCGELKVDQGYFASRTKDPCCTLRLMHYPDDLERRTEGIHPHTDFECLSILTGSTGGLQVLSRKGVWLDVETPEESFLVIAGDLLEVLSNGELESTLHRVVMSEAERYSLSFFFGFDYDVVVEPLSSLGTMDTSTYSAIHSGEHLVAMNVRTFRHLRRRVVQNEITLPMQVPSENPFIARKLQRVRTDKS
jgi:isopenicillin N synthase-like dioxygenase